MDVGLCPAPDVLPGSGGMSEKEDSRKYFLPQKAAAPDTVRVADCREE